MTADVEVVTAERDNALHVPTTAVTGSGANARVTVLRNGQQVTTPVVAGLKGDDATEITSGLKAGDTVVLPTLDISGLGSSSSTSGFGAGGRDDRPRSGGGSRRRRVRRALSAVARPIIAIERVWKTYGERRHDGARAARRERDRRARRVRRDHGRLRQRQVDAHERDRLPRHADRRAAI